MPSDMTEHSIEPSSVDTPATANAGVAIDRNGKLPQADLRRRLSHRPRSALRGGEDY